MTTRMLPYWQSQYKMVPTGGGEVSKYAWVPGKAEASTIAPLGTIVDILALLCTQVKCLPLFVYPATGLSITRQGINVTFPMYFTVGSSAVCRM